MRIPWWSYRRRRKRRRSSSGGVGARLAVPPRGGGPRRRNAAVRKARDRQTGRSWRLRFACGVGHSELRGAATGNCSEEEKER